ncbi:DUF2490 domain-containing protein [Nonlabens xiamenensis]|uniref:DUF2490 domain-containing protein n=1 Tax=Nonlabens xiamenensis TaxID=2341043 RepID=UPI000F609338|nr:DUF2490 domain-containing protein [Nonlabens xiamenensis]
MTSFYFRWFFLLLPMALSSQVIDDLLVQPAVNLSWHNNARWSFNTAAAQRNSTNDGWDALHVQVAQFASYEIGFYTQLGAGVMYRELLDEDSPEEIRFTEQFVHARKYNAFKLAHRLRWDQRWRDQRITHRWRYRLSASLPLNGSVTDASEWYLTGSLEALFIAENNKNPSYDQRTSLGLGRKISKDIKIQFVGEYRFEDFSRDNEKLLFLNLGLYYSM